MTIKDLAKLSGYSLGTVSRVLNNQPNVSEQARKTILALVEEHGFERNASAQLLKQQRTKSVLIVVKGTSNEMFAAMVEKLQSLFADTGTSSSSAATARFPTPAPSAMRVVSKRSGKTA